MCDERCVFSPNLFKLHSKILLSDLADMPRFVISSHYINNNMMQMTLSWWKIQMTNWKVILERIVDVSKRIWLNNNCKRECILLSKKDSVRCIKDCGSKNLKNTSPRISLFLLLNFLLPLSQTLLYPCSTYFYLHLLCFFKFCLPSINCFHSATPTSSAHKLGIK